MSESKRKIGHYLIEFVNEQTMIKLENTYLKKYFNSLLDTIVKTSFELKKVDLTQTKKFYYIVDFEEIDNIICIRFESAKIGHRPQLINETTGDKRSNPKSIHEGEAEVTHIAIKFNQDHMIVAFEERKVGLTINQFTAYLNKFIGQYNKDEPYNVSYEIIPYDGFEKHLQEFKRITVGHIIVDKQDLGSDFLNMANLGESVRTPVELVFKSEHGGTIKKELIRKWNEFIGREQKIKRIKIEGESNNGEKIRLDTDSLKMVKHLNVDLEETGTVNSNDLFSKLIKELRAM